MVDSDSDFGHKFFRALSFDAIEQDDPRYVPLREGGSHDPVKLMVYPIQSMQTESVQLFSGYRGSGKTTELKRCERKLTELGYHVVFIDLEDYFNLATPIDVTDFLIGLAAAFGEKLKADELLGKDATHESYWERAAAFLSRTEISPTEVSTGATGLSLKAGLKQDPTFRQQLQERLAGHLGALVAEVRSFFADCVARMRSRHGPDARIVLIADSLERIRGTLKNADEVHQSVERLFTQHSEKLHFDGIHVIYSVPHYLKVLHPNLESFYSGASFEVLPSLKVRERQVGEREGAPCEGTLVKLRTVVEKRGDWRRLLASQADMDRLILLSGGHLRDLFRFLQEVLRRADAFPAASEVVDAAISQVRNSYLPLAENDAIWLSGVRHTGLSGLRDRDNLPELARFLDTHLALCYRNGDEWYDVHPLIVPAIEKLVANAAKRDGGSEPSV